MEEEVEYGLSGFWASNETKKSGASDEQKKAYNDIKSKTGANFSIEKENDQQFFVINVDGVDFKFNITNTFNYWSMNLLNYRKANITTENAEQIAIFTQFAEANFHQNNNFIISFANPTLEFARGIDNLEILRELTDLPPGADSNQ